MGNGESTEEKKDEKKAEPLVDQSTKLTEVSTGFHVFELHLPTLGTGLFWIFILCLLVFATILLYRRCQRRWNRRHSSSPTGVLPMYHRRQHSPQIVYVVGRNDLPALHQPLQRFEELPPDVTPPERSAPSSGVTASRLARPGPHRSDGPLTRAFRGDEETSE